MTTTTTSSVAAGDRVPSPQLAARAARVLADQTTGVRAVPPEVLSAAREIHRAAESSRAARASRLVGRSR